jgi:hypothetical protein
VWRACEPPLADCRPGEPFEYAEYASPWADFRDSLKLGQSENIPEGAESVAAKTEKVKALRVGNELEARPERVVRKPRAERPVMARIRERRGVG